MSVEGLVVLVTGGARGMGREYIRGFLRAGAKVIATDLSWPPLGISPDDEDFLAEVRDNANVLVESMDVTIDAHVRRVFEAAMRRFGTIDVIINNAGLRQRDLYPPHGSVTLLETETGDWQRMFDTHVFGAVRVIKTFTPPMLEKRRGSIINIGSGGWAGQARASREMPYKAAKAALANLTFYVAHELEPHNIAANLLLPGHTRSTGSDEQEAARAALRARLHPERPPVSPLRVKPDHVVPLALFLAQQDARSVTGQEISALQWNSEHGHGGLESWGYGPDLEAARAAGRL
jgi:NAD(P)-dependent dehydrogenase (short-subunit alcohol dehydrogenase family)